MAHSKAYTDRHVRISPPACILLRSLTNVCVAQINSLIASTKTQRLS